MCIQHLKFEVIPSTFPEDLDKAKFTPSEYVQKNAELKALQVFESLCAEKGAKKPDLVIGADTVVVFKDQILEKPKDAAQAKQMLSALSGNTHVVASGVCLVDKNRAMHRFVQTTEVTFAELSDAMIDAYVDTKESMDKAGGYGMQAIGGQFISKINGCYFNVVGFPLQLCCAELRQFLGLDAEKEVEMKHDDELQEEEQEEEDGGVGKSPPPKKQKI